MCSIDIEQEELNFFGVQPTEAFDDEPTSEILVGGVEVGLLEVWLVCWVHVFRKSLNHGFAPSTCFNLAIGIEAVAICANDKGVATRGQLPREMP